MAVGALGGLVELLEDQLGDLHPGAQQDGQVRHVRQLEHDGALEAGVDETGGGVHLQAESAEAALAVDDADDVVGAADHFGGVAQSELARFNVKTSPLGMLTVSMSLVCSSNGSMWVSRLLRMTRNSVPRRTSTLAGCTRVGVVRVEDDATGAEKLAQGAVGEDHAT